MKFHGCRFLGALQSAALIVGFGLALVLPGYAVDGIAVSMHGHVPWVEPWDTLWKYEIKDDQVVRQTALFTGASRYPSINVSGTHVAFFRKATDGTTHIAVMPLQGGPVVDLCKANTGDYTCSKGILDWTVDDWLYFTNSISETGGDWCVYRVNYRASPAVPELVYRASANIWSGALSLDGKRGFFALGGGGNGMIRVDFAGTPEETKWCNYNCGAGLSPSGTYLLNFSGGGHTAYSMQTWDNDQWCTTDLPTVSDFNYWCLNCNGFVDTCDRDHDGNPTDPSYYTVGYGASGDQNRFSVNSDKWFCTDIGMGWYERYQMCSGNQILINWVDQKTINVSRHPRSCLRTDDVQCHQNAADSWTVNEGGDFIVTAPVEDILPEFRQYLGALRAAPAGSPPRLRGTRSAVGVYDLRGNRLTLPGQRCGIYLSTDGRVGVVTARRN